MTGFCVNEAVCLNQAEPPSLVGFKDSSAYGYGKDLQDGSLMYHLHRKVPRGYSSNIKIISFYCSSVAPRSSQRSNSDDT